jgi:hypothetical protein
LVENNYGYAEGDLAKLCRVALEKSFRMDIPVPEFSVKKNDRALNCRNPLAKIDQHWRSVI